LIYSHGNLEGIKNQRCIDNELVKDKRKMKDPLLHATASKNQYILQFLDPSELKNVRVADNISLVADQFSFVVFQEEPPVFSPATYRRRAPIGGCL
jgi:hypothetical protein